MSERVEERLKALGLEIPEASSPAANYVPYVVSGGLIFVSGQLPVEGGEMMYKGRLGDGVSEEEGYEAAKLCGVNILAQVKRALDGDLDRVQRVVRLGGFVASTPEFTAHPRVVNGASDLMVDVFAEKGRHARAAVGVSALPLGVSVEVEALVAFV